MIQAGVEMSYVLQDLHYQIMEEYNVQLKLEVMEVLNGHRYDSARLITEFVKSVSGSHGDQNNPHRSNSSISIRSSFLLNSLLILVMDDHGSNRTFLRFLKDLFGVSS